MKVVIEVNIPEIKEVEYPTEYKTPLGSVEHEQDAIVTCSVLEYLQRLEDIQWLINSNIHHVLYPFCREVVRSRLTFVKEENIYQMGDVLGRFLLRFREGIGYNFEDEKFEYKVNCTGKKFKFDKYLKAFDTEQEAIDWYIDVAVSNKDHIVKEML